MNSDFIITSIERVVLVGAEEYSEKVTSFTSPLYSNELIFHFSGECTVYFNEKTLHTSANTLRFLPKGENRQYVVDRKSDGSCIDIFFSSNKDISSEAFVIKSESNKRIAPLFKKLFSLWVAKDSGYYFECVSLLYKIFAEIQKVGYMSEKKFSNIQPAVSYIQNNFTTEIISSKKLEDLCGISYSYIKKLFSLKFGMTPKSYALFLKMNYAGELLSSGLYNVTKAAYMCGYMELSFFNRQFKKHYSMTPTEFIRKYKSSK